MNKIEVCIDHIGLPDPIKNTSVTRDINGMESWNKIEKMIVDSVGDRLRALLIVYTYFITLIDTDGRQYSLHDDVTREKKLLNTNGYNSEVKTLKVIWSLKSNTHPTESIAKNDVSTQTDIQFQTTDPDISSVDELFGICFKVPPSEDIESEKEEFDQFLTYCNNQSKTGQTGISDNGSIGNLLELLKDSSSTFSPTQQNNSIPTSSSSEQRLNSTEGQDNDSMANQNQCSLKRPNQSKGDTNAKKRTKRINKQDQSRSTLPQKMKMMNTYITKDKKPEFIEADYDPTKVHLLSNYNKEKMIQFKENIDQTERSRYSSESKKVPRIQGKKERKSEVVDKSKDSMLPGIVNKSKDSILPIIKLPLAYERQNCVLLAFACVKEHRSVEIDEKEGIEFCHVGYQKFKYYSKDAKKMLPMSVIYPNEEDKKAGQLIFQIIPFSNGKSEYTLIAHSFKVNDKSEKEIGPAMFRLSAEYIQAAGEDGFKFGQNGLTHRYVAYLFKFNEQSNRYEPDFETLVLSDYMYYDSNEEEEEDEQTQ